MSNPNVTASSIGNAPELSADSVGASPSTLTNAKKSRSQASLKVKAHVAPADSNDSEKHKKSRSENRVPIIWHADAIIDKHGEYHGFVKDISSKGTSIFLEYALPNVKFIKLRIHVLTLNHSGDARVVEVSGKIVYTTFDNNEYLFRTGVKFQQFNLETDQEFLHSCIAKQ